MSEHVNPEWQRMADDEPYRIAFRWSSRPRWFVYDIRPEPELEVAGPFLTRVEALAEADRLNATVLPVLVR